MTEMEKAAIVMFCYAIVFAIVWMAYMLHKDLQDIKKLLKKDVDGK